MKTKEVHIGDVIYIGQFGSFKISDIEVSHFDNSADIYCKRETDEEGEIYLTSGDIVESPAYGKIELRKISGDGKCDEYITINGKQVE